MKKTWIVLVVVGCVLYLSVQAVAAQSPVDIVAEGCKQDIATHCKGVTPGEGRILACLYAYEDKLSSRCEYALYDASAQLQKAIVSLTYLANECRDDLKNYCSDIKPGEGRLIDCISKNQGKISERCKQAIKDVGN